MNTSVVKSEIRSPRSEGNPNTEYRNPKPEPLSGTGPVSPPESSGEPIRISDFGLPSDFGFRISDFRPVPFATAAAALLPSASAIATPSDDLLANIKSSDDKVRGPAWQGAASAGVSAVKPLATVMSDPDFETARCAKRALWIIVRHAGRPGAKAERKAVQAALIDLLSGQPAPVRKEVLWMLSEIGDDKAVAPMAALLGDAEVREDARCAITRLPDSAATKALEQAFKSAPEDFKFALAESLRQRGKTVAGYPSQKLKPVKQTSIKPAGQ